MFIEDGTGKGFRAEVDSKNRLDVHAENESRREGLDSGKSWSLAFNVTDPAGADDYFVHINNTGSATYIITDIRTFSTVAGSIEVHKVTGTASYAGAVALDITSRNLGSAVLPTGTFNSDTNTTGLTNAGVLMYMYHPANTNTDLLLRAGIIVPPGTQIALLWDTGTGILSGTISMYEHPEGAS